jgi:hypothetical protein
MAISPRASNCRNSRLLGRRSDKRAISSGANQWTDSTSHGLATGIAAGDNSPNHQASSTFHGVTHRHSRRRGRISMANSSRNSRTRASSSDSPGFDAAARKTIDQRGPHPTGAANHQHAAVAHRDAHHAAPAGIVGNRVYGRLQQRKARKANAAIPPNASSDGSGTTAPAARKPTLRL